MTKLATTLLLSLALLTGCCSGHVSASALEDTIAPVMSRHDNYVKQDAAMSPLERRVALRSTFLLRKTLAEALDPNATKE